MQQTKYDYNALKLEYFKSDIDEIKWFWIDKGLNYNTRVATMTKGRWQEKQERRKSILEKALERQKDKISKELEIPVEDLLKIKKDVIDLMKHKVKQYTQKVELAVEGEDVPINTKDLEKIRKVAKVELWEPMIVTKNEWKTTLETSWPLVEIICSEEADEMEDDEMEDDE